jgi:hypothetical protein
MGDQTVARPLLTDGTTQTKNKRTQTSIPGVGLEPSIPVFERAKMAHALGQWPHLLRPRERTAVEWPQLSCMMDVIEKATGRTLPFQRARCPVRLHTNLGRNTRLAGTWSYDKTVAAAAAWSH